VQSGALLTVNAAKASWQRLRRERRPIYGRQADRPGSRQLDAERRRLVLLYARPRFRRTDSFTYVANDGADSAPATVVITVVGLWHLTIRLQAATHVPNGELYTPVIQAARFADASATIHYMEDDLHG